MYELSTALSTFKVNMKVVLAKNDNHPTLAALHLLQAWWMVHATKWLTAPLKILALLI